VSWRTICAIAASALLLAGRGGDNRPGTAPPSNDLQKADPCALLTDAEAATQLGVAQATHAREDLAGIGPGCMWKATGADASVGVLLNQPTNQDRNVQRAKRRVDVAGKPGCVRELQPDPRRRRAGVDPVQWPSRCRRRRSGRSAGDQEQRQVYGW
jgi:hypothetical protein